jgi:putative ABC transport system substrate-binding protein
MQFDRLRRREFIMLLGGMAAQRSVARAQSRMPILGYLWSTSKTDDARGLPAFRQGLADYGFIEDQNLKVVYRYADGQYDRLPALAAELVRYSVDVIVAGPSSPAAVAAKNATSTIPIVFSIGADPVELGLVASFSRPGANVTGIDVAPESLTAKRFEWLNDLVPKSRPFAELVNPANRIVEFEKRSANEAARVLGRELHFINASTAAEIGFGFEEMASKQIGGLVVWFEALFGQQREQIVSLANRYRIPTIYPFREFVKLGGLVSYGPNVSVSRRQLGVYVGRILKGARPNELPVMTPATYDLVINLTTAKALGLNIPQNLTVTAEVIE